MIIIGWIILVPVLILLSVFAISCLMIGVVLLGPLLLAIAFIIGEGWLIFSGHGDMAAVLALFISFPVLIGVVSNRGFHVSRKDRKDALAEHRRIRWSIERRVFEGFRSSNHTTAKLENQSIFAEDNYQQIVERVAEQEALRMGLWNDARAESRLSGPRYGQWAQTMFHCAVRDRANDIILERLKAESDRVLPVIAAAVFEEYRQKRSGTTVTSPPQSSQRDQSGWTRLPED